MFMSLNQAAFDSIMEFIGSLEKNGLSRSEAELALHAAIKRFREQRYFGRGPELASQKWMPVLRAGFQQYEVSDWGYVRHKKKKTALRPAFEHSYARAPMKAPHRKSGGAQHMIHELVYESHELGVTLESKGIKKGYEVINHKDGDKWNPALSNLEPTSQGKNMLHAYEQDLRKPRA
jgi:hypothetical protein